MIVFKRRITKWIWLLFLSIFMLVGLLDVKAQASANIFIAYTGTTADLKDKLIKTLPKQIPVKAYNVNLLAIMDFSGRNKALLRMNASRLIIILGDATMKILKNARINTDLLIVQSRQETLRSSRWTLYILGQETSLKDFKPSVKRKKVSKIEDLGSEQDLRALTVLIVDKQSIPLQDVIAEVVEKTIR